MRKIYATLTVNLILNADSDLDISDYLDNSELALTCSSGRFNGKADVQDLTIENVEVTDSK